MIGRLSWRGKHARNSVLRKAAGLAKKALIYGFSINRGVVEKLFAAVK
jgi:hypothetical protein